MLKLFRNRVTLFASLILLVSVSAHAAQPVCNTLAECQSLRAQVDRQITKLQAGQPPVFLDIERDLNGKVKGMNQSDAIQYCSIQGARLPSIRELAQLFMSFGAKGIMDSCGTDKNCYKVSNIQNADGSKDEFYFSYSGYQRPIGDLGDNWIWSSSVESSQPGSAFGLNGTHGAISFDSRNYRGGVVRCVVGR